MFAVRPSLGIVGKVHPKVGFCSGCRNVGPINNNLGNAQGTFSNEFPGVELMGVFGTMTFSGPQKTAIKRIVNSSPVHVEDIWGVGIAAEHVTTPGTNIAVVFTRPQGGGYSGYLVLVVIPEKIITNIESCVGMEELVACRGLRRGIKGADADRSQIGPKMLNANVCLLHTRFNARLAAATSCVPDAESTTPR
jgi:hypothetical protein